MKPRYMAVSTIIPKYFWEIVDMKTGHRGPYLKDDAALAHWMDKHQKQEDY